MSRHFRTRDVLKLPANQAAIHPESSHAPRPAEHDDEPVRVLGGRAAHPTPVLLSTRISSCAEKLLEERAELTIVAKYQGPDRAKGNQCFVVTGCFPFLWFIGPWCAMHLFAFDALTSQLTGH